jgi:Family of unknown function (DUF6502)
MGVNTPIMVEKQRIGALTVCRAALRALVRMLLKHGVMHRELVELSKEIYVDVARRDYGIRGRPTNVARMALLTGLDRKEITRIKKKLDDQRRDEETDTTPQRQQDRVSRVLSGWHQDPNYVDAGGKPRILPLNGPAPSYADLVKRYGGDVPPSTILRELKRTGAVRVTSGEALEVQRRNYRLDTVSTEALARAASVLADIGHTVTHNLYHDARQQSRFEARASNVNIPPRALPAYREFIYRESQAFLERVDAWLSQHEVPDAEAQRTAAQRVGVGVYWIQSDET